MNNSYEAIRALQTQLFSIKVEGADKAMLDHQVTSIMDMLPTKGIEQSKIADITKTVYDSMVYQYRIGNLRCFQGFVKPDELKIESSK